jgi:YidC/Oxa1 family membrane protein insertase
MMDFGLIILLMTVIIKIVLFPLTYKSFLSSAKMRVLKPQIDEINAKIPKEKTMERQQETMKLYRKAGVNPMGGCIPLLLQFPILLAMYNFFPASIELRQKSFLWVSDLSTYDSIWTFPGGFSIPMYGDHISLFALLMAIAMLISTVMNGSQMATTNQQMPGMKLMMYLMPVMMVLWFNNYSAGLSYYYFLSNVITIGQTLLIRRMVDENKLLEQLNARKAKPQTKSRFREKMEQIQKVQQQQLKHKKK